MKPMSRIYTYKDNPSLHWLVVDDVDQDYVMAYEIRGTGKATMVSKRLLAEQYEEVPQIPTTKQNEILEAITKSLSENGSPPSYRKIAEITGLTVGAVQSQLNCLRKKGLVTWSDGEARSLKRIYA